MIGWAFKAARRRRSGQVSIEMLLVFVPWFALVMLFFNFLLIVGSLMLNQATVNRGALQVSSLGCLPSNLRSEIENRSFLGASDVEIRAITPLGKPETFQRDNYLDDNGKIDGSNAKNLPDCSGKRNVVESGRYILVQASYHQDIVLLDALGINAGFDVNRNALVVSNSLEDSP